MFINDNKHRLSFIRGAKDRIMTISSTGYFSAKATTTTTPRSLNPSPLLKTRPSRPMRCVVWIVEWMRYQPTDQRTQPVIEVLWPFDAPKQHKTLISVQWKEKSGKSQMPFTGAMVGGEGEEKQEIHSNLSICNGSLSWLTRPRQTMPDTPHTRQNKFLARKTGRKKTNNAIEKRKWK